MRTPTQGFTAALLRGEPSRDRLCERGERLGPYEVLLPLASGARAAVYAAREHGEGLERRAVALKVLHPKLANDPDFARLFIEETGRAARVRSPAVAAFLEPAQLHETTLFVAMELVVGVSARELFEAARRRNTPLSPRIASALAIEAAAALAAVHTAKSLEQVPLGLVHGDVSAHNLIVGADGHARLSDFGLVRSLERASALFDGERGARLSYAAPEQMRGEPLDVRSDLFSLGVVVWELLTGQRLFDAPNPLTTAQRIAVMPIPRVGELQSEVPKPLADVIARLLERDPARRPPSAQACMRELTEASRASGIAEPDEVARAVRELCGTHVTGIERALGRALGEPVGARPSDSSSQRVLTRMRTVPRRGATLLAAGALVLGLGALALWSGRGQPEAQVARASAGVEPPKPIASAPPVAAASTPPPAPVAPVAEVTPEPRAKVAKVARKAPDRKPKPPAKVKPKVRSKTRAKGATHRQR